MDFYWLVENKSSFVQKITDRIYKELNSANIFIQIACLQELPYYINHSAIKNKSTITSRLQDKLNDKNWKIRLIAFQALSEENLLPDGYKLSFMDKLRKLFSGKKSTV